MTLCSISNWTGVKWLLAAFYMLDRRRAEAGFAAARSSNLEFPSLLHGVSIHLNKQRLLHIYFPSPFLRPVGSFWEMAAIWCLSMFFSPWVGESMRNIFHDEVGFYLTGQNEGQLIDQHNMSKEKRVQRIVNNIQVKKTQRWKSRSWFRKVLNDVLETKYILKSWWS